MQISGKIIQVLPQKEGMGKNGKAWHKAEYVLETPDTYPKRVLIGVLNDRINELGLAKGMKVTLAVDVESREFNGRWYTDVTAYKLVDKDADNTSAANFNPPY